MSTKSDHDAIKSLTAEVADLRRRLAEAEAEASRREQDEAGFRESAAKFETLINESVHAYGEFDLEGYFTYANDVAVELTGRRVEERVNIRDLIIEEDHQRAIEDLMLVFSEPNLGPKEYRFRNRHGEVRHGEVNTLPIRRNGEIQGFQTTILDVTDRKRVEQERAELLEQLYHSQKMEAVGALAGGIAHDFNNLLCVILGCSELLKTWSEPDTKIAQASDTIERAAERASALTAQLLGFARKGKHRISPIDVHLLIQEVVGLLERVIPKNIAIEQSLDAPTPIVDGDPDQLHQVFINLAINARDAMSEGGQLVFSTQETILDEKFCRPYPEMKPGPHLRLAVTDTGVGIAKEDQRRIFEPFFSTKEEGVGLGLAMVYGIVTNHNAAVEVESASGRGSTFTIYVPVSSRASEVTEAAPVEVVDERVDGSGKILLVDDEDVLLEVTTMMLEDMGYEVLSADNGAEAIELYGKNHEQIDLVIIDMIMPKMTGDECFLALQRINPAIKAILATGYGLDGRAQKILDLGVRGFIQKPYHMDGLRKAIEEVLKG